MDKLQGEPIEFSLLFTQGSNPAITSFLDFDEIFIQLFVDSCYIIQFSTVQTEGFILLEVLEAGMKLKGVAPESATNLLAAGALQYELKCVLDDEPYKKKGQTGINILKSLSKNI